MTNTSSSPGCEALAARVEAHMNSLSDYDPSWGILIECAKALRAGFAQTSRNAVIEECAKHLESCGFRYSQGFDVPEILRRLKVSCPDSSTDQREGWK